MIQTPLGHGLGRKPDLGDIRDFRLAVPRHRLVSLPPMVDLRPDLPPVGDQGQLGSCTAWASLAAWRYARWKQGMPDLDGSELAQYYWTRLIENTVAYDSGASIRDAIKTLAERGVAPETIWPYQPDLFTMEPPEAVQRVALTSQVVQYTRVEQNIDQIRGVLAQGLVVVFGISVYPSFEEPDHGFIPMPSVDEQLLGGHAIALVGYNDATAHALFRNSWGADWGEGGYGWLPYEFVLNSALSSDFWVLNRLES